MFKTSLQQDEMLLNKCYRTNHMIVRKLFQEFCCGDTVSCHTFSTGPSRIAGEIIEKTRPQSYKIQLRCGSHSAQKQKHHSPPCGSHSAQHHSPPFGSQSI